MEIEHFFICPYCGQSISLVVDLTVSYQQYFEDCEVCCKPILIDYSTLNGALTAFDAKTADE